MRRQLAVPLTLAIIASIFAFTSVARATPGFLVSSTVKARAAFQAPVDIKIKIDEGRQEVIHVPDSQDTLMQQIVFLPGGHSGGHSHPGPAIAMVTAGELTLYDGDDPTCSGRIYRAGQAFIDAGQGHVHMARNESSTDNAEVWVTYLDVPPAPAGPRLDQPQPATCSF